MRKRSLLFVGLVVAVGSGVWVGVTAAGTAATPWIEGAIAAGLIIAGAAIFLSPDPVDQRTAQLHGAGLAIFGVAQFAPSPWSLAMLTIALGLMVASIIRRRRRAAARHTV